MEIFIGYKGDERQIATTTDEVRAAVGYDAVWCYDSHGNGYCLPQDAMAMVQSLCDEIDRLQERSLSNRIQRVGQNLVCKLSALARVGKRLAQTAEHFAVHVHVLSRIRKLLWGKPTLFSCCLGQFVAVLVLVAKLSHGVDCTKIADAGCIHYVNSSLFVYTQTKHKTIQNAQLSSYEQTQLRLQRG